MKKEFLEPEVELIRLNVTDVITFSGDPDLGDNELPWVDA